MRASLVLSIVLLTACGGDPDPVTDAGPTRRDASADAAPFDAGPETRDDAATPGDDDASVEPDAGPVGPPTSMGCIDGDGLAEGEHRFDIAGQPERRYVLRLPEGYTRDRAWPLVLALHGNGGSTSYWDGDDAANGRNMGEILANDAILIIVQAIDRQWHDYSLSEPELDTRLESELVYFEEVLSQAKTALCVREDAIFSMGFSGGGSFSGVLACRRSDIRGIAVGGSVLYFEKTDECVGQSAAWIAISEGDLNSARERYRDFFRERAGCDAASAATPPASCTAYEGCDDATPVHYCPYPGGHAWPAFGGQGAWDFFESLID